VVTAGFTARAGLDFERLEAITGGVLDAELVTDGADGRARGPHLDGLLGVALEKSRIPLLSGGMYRKEDPSAARNWYLRFDVHESNLAIRRGTDTASLILPRTELQVSDATSRRRKSLSRDDGGRTVPLRPEAPAWRPSR
jgi:hypothetical protein